tara:strand:+ start:1338 stop:1604 length:267 start_codon:yes stop_codon:yes gene_type:complete
MDTKIKIENRADSVARLEEQLKLNRELLFFNGSQWYIKADEDCVIIFDTGNLTDMSYTIMSRNWSVEYIKNNRNSKDFKECLELYKNC